MAEQNDLSPWAHPKAKAWFRALFRRTSLPLALEDELKKPEEQLNIEIVRTLMTFAVLLSRPEIWPKRDHDVLEFIVAKAKEFCDRPAKSSTGKPLTIAEHKAHSRAVAEITHDIELVRRRLGLSVRKSKIHGPASWEPFWE